MRRWVIWLKVSLSGSLKLKMHPNCFRVMAVFWIESIPGYGRFPFFGKVRNLYAYNRYLTDAEIVLDNTTPGCITDGCMFGAPSVITHTLSDYDNLTMTEGDKVFDSIGGFIGTPKNSPVSQLIV